MMAQLVGEVETSASRIGSAVDQGDTGVADPNIAAVDHTRSERQGKGQEAEMLDRSLQVHDRDVTSAK